VTRISFKGCQAFRVSRLDCGTITLQVEYVVGPKTVSYADITLHDLPRSTTEALLEQFGDAETFITRESEVAL